MLKLKEKYIKEVIPQMMEKFGYKNVMVVPKIEKAVVNIGFGRLMLGKTKGEQKKFYQAILNDLSLITGQKAVLTKAKKSISTFKIRKGMSIGSKIVLRKKKMYDFLEKLVCIVLPRSRDFRGIKKTSIDKQGNITIGIKEHITFPEISPEKTESIFGLEVVVTTTAKNKEEGLELLRLMGFPIKS